MDKLSYALGMLIADNVKSFGVESINVESFNTAVAAVLKGEPTSITPQEAQQEVQEFMSKQEQRRGAAARKAGEDFLAENAKKEGVITLPSGLQYKVLQEGNGKKPSAKDTVVAHYEGTLIDGQVFDSSYQRGEPATFPLNQVIKGWTEGVQLMQEGAKYRFFIPFDLAYGTRGAGQAIPPYATLIFDVELVKVK